VAWQLFLRFPRPRRSGPVTQAARALSAAP